MAERDLTPYGGRGLTSFGFGGRDPFSHFRREMDRLFDDFFAPTEARSFAGASGAAVWPSIDVEQTKVGYKVTAELPGLEQKDVEVELRDDLLTIRGEKKAERSEGEGHRAWTERTYGRFERTLRLPGEVDAGKVQAKFKNGVLSIELPRSAKAQDLTRKIEVKGA
jgi:HSP20 family protein